MLTLGTGSMTGVARWIHLLGVEIIVTREEELKSVSCIKGSYLEAKSLLNKEKEEEVLIWQPYKRALEEGKIRRIYCEITSNADLSNKLKMDNGLVESNN